jgi:hypothetical protein
VRRPSAQHGTQQQTGENPDGRQDSSRIRECLHSRAWRGDRQKSMVKIHPPSFNAFLHFGLPHGKSSVGFASEPAHIINQTGFANIPTVDS